MKKFINRICWSLLGGFLLLGALLQLPIIRTYVKERLIETIEQHSALSISIDQVRLYPAFQITLEGVKITTKGGTTVDTDALFLDLSPTKLFQGELYFNRIDIETLKLTSSIQNNATTAQILPNIAIDDLLIRQIILETPDFSNAHSPIRFKGGVHINKNQLQAKGQIALSKEIDRWLEFALDGTPAYGKVQIKSNIGVQGSCRYQITEEALKLEKIYLTTPIGIASGNFSFSLTTKKFASTIKLVGIVGDQETIKGEAILTGTPSYPKLSIFLASDQLTLFNRSWIQPRFSGQLFPKADKIVGEATLSFLEEGEAFSFETNLVWEQELFPLKPNISLKSSLISIIDLLELPFENKWGNITGTLFLEYVEGLTPYPFKILLHDGQIENFEFGSIATQIEGEAQFTESTLLSYSLQGSDLDTGILSANGNFNLSTLDFSTQFEAKNFQLVNLDPVAGNITGNALFTGSKNGGKITGKIDIDKLNIRLIEGSREFSPALKVQFLDEPDISEDLLAKEWPLFLDLTLSIGRFEISGRGLSSYWQGNAAVLGNVKEPLISGGISLTEGSYLFSGKEIDLSSGSVHFDGDPIKGTTLFVTGEIEIPPGKAEILVRGNPTDPTISFRSTPPMSEREILSWMIFGQGTTAISSTQGRKLDQSQFTLTSGRGSGLDVLSRFRESLRIDQIQLSRDLQDGKQTTVRVGKYLGSSSFLTFGYTSSRDPAQKPGRGSVGIRSQISSSLQLEADIDNDQTGQLNLWWKRSY